MLRHHRDFFAIAKMLGSTALIYQQFLHAW